MILGAFLASLLGFVAIGAASSRVATASAVDYLVAGRSVPPWLTALSSVATNNSGFMFIGMIGFTYREGVSAVWMAGAWLLGDAIAWWTIHPRLRAHSGALDARSVPRLLATDPDGRVAPALSIAAGALTFLFLGGYAAAQLQAGGTALHALFGWPQSLGSVIGAVIVVVYCFSGGLRASIWTDAAQSIVMFAAMAALLVYAAADVGGPTVLWTRLADLDPALVAWHPPDAASGLPLYALGFVAGGFGAIGQPHLLIRTMALDDVANIPRARRTYFAWFIPFYAMGVAVALYARVLLPELGTVPTDAVQATEGALPALALALLPDVLVGLTLAGLFAATMSTADSQILACSAAVTEDVFPALRDRPWAPKLATLAIATLALGIALGGSDGVFALVLSAWSALGVSLGPWLIVRLAGAPLPVPTALAMAATGLAVAFGWPADLGVFRLLPGLLAPLALYAVLRVVGPDRRVG